MMNQTAVALPELYESDETAWLEAMADLIRRGLITELDYAHLEEYLADMASRDRREVESRLVTLIAHVLKWNHQPPQRTRSWRATIIEQRQELSSHVERGVLRNHAEAVLAEVYAKAVERASAETGLAGEMFPAECPWSLDQILSFDPAAATE